MSHDHYRYRKLADKAVVYGLTTGFGKFSTVFVPEEETAQLSLGAAAQQEILRRLREAAPDTMSPIEALTLLYQLHQQAVEAE